MRIFILYIAAVLLGAHLMGRLWGGVAYIYVGEDRAPANIKKLIEYYPVEERLLHKPLAEQVYEPVSFVRRQTEIGIQLGHFLSYDAFGRRQFGCQVRSKPGLYDRVELSFWGVGVAENGKIPKMTVDATCAAEDDPSLLSTIWIPMADIYQSKPKAQELTFPDQGAAIHITDMSSTWPEQWTLMSAKFYQSGSSDTALEIDTPRTLKDQSFSFDWK